jgi:hypothetical protein
MAQSIPERVVATLSELGLPIPANMIQTTLMHDGYFVGWKVRYDGGYALINESGDTMELYDAEKKLLRTAALEPDREAA